jgi:hypothetical protein
MKTDLRALREINLAQVMKRLGCEPSSRYGGTMEYRLEDGRKIAVTPQPRNSCSGGALGMFQVWNGEALEGRTGGAGAVDLVMAVTGKPMRAALGWLAAGFFPTGNAVPIPQMPARPRSESLSLLERRFTLPARNPEATAAVHRYLCESRGLPAPLVVPLLDAGTIYAHIHSYAVNDTRRSFTNAVFVMRDDTTDAPNGSMIRGCYDGRKPRKSTLPFENGNAAAFWLGVPIAQARTVVVTESPIECLSWLALHTAAAGIHCRTYGGNRWRSVETIFGQVKATGAQLVCAFNNDEEGNRAAEEFVQFAGRVGIVAIRHQPEGMKDWNDVLRRGTTLL